MNQSDTIHIDSLEAFEIPMEAKLPVLLGMEKTEKTKFPFTENLNLEMNPDWLFYFSIGMIVVLAYIKLIYAKFMISIFSASVNYQVSLRLFKDANSVQKRISLVFFLFYFLNLSVYLFLIFDYFDYSPADLQDFRLISGIFGFLVALVIWRYMISHLVAIVFNRKKLFAEALFQNFLFNRLSGLIVLPFILIISYTKGIYADISIYLSLGILGLVNILRLVRGVKFIFKNLISYFYLILYLCSLEILPFLVVIKIIVSLSGGS